jgi:hypothetical protein
MRRPRLPALVLVACGLAASLSLVAKAQDRESSSRPPARLTITAEGEPLLSVLKRLCAQQGYNFVADDAALQRAGKVWLSLADVTFDEALDAICETYGLEGRVRGLDAHPIVVIRLQRNERAASANDDLDPQPRESPRGHPARPGTNRFLEGSGSVAPKLERAPAPQAPEPPVPVLVPSAPAPVVTSAPTNAPAAAERAPSAIVVGLVLDVGADRLTLKETKGDPREYVVPAAESDPLRNERLTRGLAHLKKGDRVALEFRADGGRSVITNLVGGGAPAQAP